MTMTPEPTDKLDTATTVAANGPADDTLPQRADRTTPRHRTCQGLLEPDARKRARPVLRGARRRKAPGLPDEARMRCRSPVAGADLRVCLVGRRSRDFEINGEAAAGASGAVGSTTALDRSSQPTRGRWAAPSGTALNWFGSVREPKPVGGRDHRRWAFVDGVDDLGVVNAPQVHGGDPEVGMSQLPLYDDQWHALARHLDRVCMPELMWRQPATHPGCDRGVAQLDADPGR